MKIRALDANGDMRFGHGNRDFIENVPEVVAQRARTRLGLWVGDWYRDPLDGTPYRTAVLGRRTDATRDPAMRARIIGTPGCVGLATYSSQQDRAKRRYSVQATIDTAFGSGAVATTIAAPNGDVRRVR